MSDFLTSAEQRRLKAKEWSEKQTVSSRKYMDEPQTYEVEGAVQRAEKQREQDAEKRETMCWQCKNDFLVSKYISGKSFFCSDECMRKYARSMGSGESTFIRNHNYRLWQKMTQ